MNRRINVQIDRWIDRRTDEYHKKKKNSRFVFQMVNSHIIFIVIFMIIIGSMKIYL